MSIPTLAADLASRIPAMAHDTPINNASVIEGMIQNELRHVEIRYGLLRAAEMLRAKKEQLTPRSIRKHWIEQFEKEAKRLQEKESV